MMVALLRLWKLSLLVIGWITACKSAQSQLSAGERIVSSFTKEMIDVEEPWYQGLIGEVIGETHPESKALPIPPRIVCEHGEVVKGSNNCTCHQGWRSLTRKEWIEKGGTIEPDGSVAINTFCSIPIMEQRKRKLLLIGFLIVTLLVPVVAILMIMSRQKANSSKDLHLKKFLDSHHRSSGNEGEEEGHNENDWPNEMQGYSENENQAHDTCMLMRGPAEEEEEEDLDKIISEITNRREQKPKTRPISKNNLQDHGQPPPPPPPPAPSSAQSQAPVPSLTSATNMDTGQQNQPTPNDVTSAHNTESGTHLPTSHSSHKIEGPGQDHLRQSISSSGFIPSKSTNLHPQNPDEVNRNTLAARSPSTDELLSMKRREKRGAHIPMEPVSSSSSKTSISAALVDLADNNNNLGIASQNQGCFRTSSLSSEAITLRKKQQWDQFIKSVSEEQLPSNKSSHLAIQLGNEDMFGTDTRVHNEHSFALGTAAIKVRSLPEMQSSHSIHMQVPPEPLIKKSLKEMQPEEFASRQEAYSLLQSLSNHTIQGGNNQKIPVNNNSIFTEPMKQSNKAEASRTSSLDEVRTQSIYGDLGSDGDSDGALEAMSNENQPLPIPTRKTVAERFEENQGFYRGSQCLGQQNNPQTFQRFKPLESGKQMEFDNLSSESYAGSSALASSSSSSEHCRTLYGKRNVNISDWMQVFSDNTDGVGKGEGRTGHDFRLTGNSARGAAAFNASSLETESAYEIKNTLDNVLKVSKSKSATRLF